MEAACQVPRHKKTNESIYRAAQTQNNEWENGAMLSDACAGKCRYEDFNLEYRIVSFTYIYKQFLSIEAICYNPSPSYHKEAVFKYSTTNLNSNDERLKVARLIMDTIIHDLDIPADNVYKLVVKNDEVFYLHST